MTVKEVVQKIAGHKYTVKKDGYKVNLLPTDIFRIYVGDDKYVYSMLDVEDMKNIACVPERIMVMDIDKVRLSSMDGMLFIDCIIKATDEFLLKFRKQINSYAEAVE